jgi:hypothetical protein
LTFAKKSAIIRNRNRNKPFACGHGAPNGEFSLSVNFY